jgi:mono/diheme cytochrome c family protein
MREMLHTPAAALLLLAGCGTVWPERAANADSAQDFAQIERGRYLTVLADCAACHTDPDTQVPFAGGRPIETPFGKVLAANITPDRETGIGNWTDEQFDTAVRGGKAPDGTRLYPAMPFPYYTRMSREDVQAMRAYLSTLPAVHHAVHSNQLPFPFNIRAGMGLWDALYFEPGTFKPDPGKSAQWNRGAYLVQGPGHCPACHTPKTKLGGDEAKEPLQGYSLQGWFAPNLTGDTATGLGHWSSADVVDYLKSGHNRVTGASGPMAEEIANSSSKMSDADLQAIAAYLKDQPGQGTAGVALKSAEPVMTAGAAIYRDLCSGCHAPDGQGVAYLIPNLAASSSVASREPTSVLQVLIRGARTVATDPEPTAPAMPAFARQLNDAQLAAVATFIRNSWGHAASATTAREVQQARQRLLAPGS